MLNDLRIEPEPTTADKLNLYSLEELAKETALDFGLPINVIKNNDIFCSEKKKKSENYLIYSYDNNRITLIKEMPVREHFSIEVDKHKINVNYIIWSNDLSRLVETLSETDDVLLLNDFKNAMGRQKIKIVDKNANMRYLMMKTDEFKTQDIKAILQYMKTHFYRQDNSPNTI